MRRERAESGAVLFRQSQDGQADQVEILLQTVQADIFVRLMLRDLVAREAGAEGQDVGHGFGIGAAADALGLRLLAGVGVIDAHEFAHQGRVLRHEQAFVVHGGGELEAGLCEGCTHLRRAVVKSAGDGVAVVDRDAQLRLAGPEHAEVEASFLAAAARACGDSVAAERLEKPLDARYLVRKEGLLYLDLNREWRIGATAMRIISLAEARGSRFRTLENDIMCKDLYSNFDYQLFG